MHEPFIRPRTTLDLRAPGGLAALFAQTRREFGGHTMTAGPTPEPAPTPAPTPTPEPAPAPTPGPAPQPTGQSADADAPREGEDAAAFLARVGPEKAAAIALSTRREAGDRRVQLREEQAASEQRQREAADAARTQLLEQMKPALVALGIVQPDATPDPAKLTGDLQARTTELEAERTASRTLRIENHVLQTAPGLGVDAGRLLDSRRFADTVASLDPTADDFGAKIEAAMKDAVKADASFKSTRAVPAAGMPHVGGSGGQPGTLTPQPLADAVAAAMNPNR